MYLRPHPKKSLFRLTRLTAFWMADRKLFSRLHRNFFVCTHVCEWLVSLAISHVNAKRECERASASDALPTRKSKLASAKLKITREYSQTNTQLLAIVLASTRNRTRQYSWVLAIICVGSNFYYPRMSRDRVNELWCSCGMTIRGKLVPRDALSWLYYNNYMLASVILYKRNIFKKIEKLKTDCPPVKFLAVLVETETIFIEALSQCSIDILILCIASESTLNLLHFGINLVCKG